MAPKRRYGLVIATLVALVGAAAAQPLPPANIPNSAPPPPPSQQQQPQRTQQFPPSTNASPVCARLESALADLNRNTTGGNPDAAARYEDAIQRQRQELDQAIGTSRRLGCERRGFFIFGGNQRPEQCNTLDPQIDRMRANLDRMTAELAQVRGGSNDGNYTRDLQRRQVLASLSQNNCGPQYRNVNTTPTQRPRGFLDQLFGNNDESPGCEPERDAGRRGLPHRLRAHVRRLLLPDQFCDRAVAFRAKTKRSANASARPPKSRSIPTAIPVRIFSRPSRFPASFTPRRRTHSNTAPSSIQAAPAVGPVKAGPMHSARIKRSQRGDIIVTEQRSKQLSQPQIAPMSPKQKNAPQSFGPNAVPSPNLFDTPPTQQTEQPAPTKNDGKRRVRVVGPQFYPVPVVR